MSKRNWKIIYASYEGMEKKAVELVSKEMGSFIVRDNGIYTIHVLPCEKEKSAVIDRNVVIIGLFDESKLIQKYIHSDEVKEDGYVVKVMENPENEEWKLVLITAKEEAALFYGAVDFVDDYFVKAAPIHGAVRLCDEIFDFPLPDYYHASAPAIKTRSAWTWGTPINDYRNYIENMARLKLNQLVMWNDYAPLNAKDIVEYAHEFGIKVIWGFAWGWSTNCAEIDFHALDKLTEDIIKTYEEQYASTGGDGIYFQSFTELPVDTIGDKLIAEVVTDFVNLTSGKLLQKHPELFIQFGLHATSVKDHLTFISKVDPRVEIMWEDCGSFPYSYDPYENDPDKYQQTLDFTDKILTLREEGSVSVLFKGFMTLDWVGRFVHQAGPYILGMSSDRIIKHDKEMLKQGWRQLQSGWLQNGKAAYKMARYIYENTNHDASIGLTGQFAGSIWFPEALCAQILWECDKSYEEIFDKVSRRRCVDII